MQSSDLETTKLGEFLRDLGQALAAPYTTRPGKVTLNVTVEPHDAAIKIDFAIPLGLLVTELVSNACKHAFRPGQPGTIDVSLAIAGEGKARLDVSNNDIGMPTAPPPATIGQCIIVELVDQLGGEMTMNRNHGTHITVTFPCPPELPC
jgi:two-component sensor histidine kinase